MRETQHILSVGATSDGNFLSHWVGPPTSGRTAAATTEEEEEEEGVIGHCLYGHACRYSLFDSSNKKRNIIPLHNQCATNQLPGQVLFVSFPSFAPARSTRGGEGEGRGKKTKSRIVQLCGRSCGTRAPVFHCFQAVFITFLALRRILERGGCDRREMVIGSVAFLPRQEPNDSNGFSWIAHPFINYYQPHTPPSPLFAERCPARTKKSQVFFLLFPTVAGRPQDGTLGEEPWSHASA